MEGLEYKTMDMLHWRMMYSGREVIDWMPLDDIGTVLVIINDFVYGVYVVMTVRLSRRAGIRTEQLARFRHEQSAREFYENTLEECRR